MLCGIVWQGLHAYVLVILPSALYLVLRTIPLVRSPIDHQSTANSYVIGTHTFSYHAVNIETNYVYKTLCRVTDCMRKRASP